MAGFDFSAYFELLEVGGGDFVVIKEGISENNRVLDRENHCSAKDKNYSELLRILINKCIYEVIDKIVINFFLFIFVANNL